MAHRRHKNHGDGHISAHAIACDYERRAASRRNPISDNFLEMRKEKIALLDRLRVLCLWSAAVFWKYDQRICPCRKLPDELFMRMKTAEHPAGAVNIEYNILDLSARGGDKIYRHLAPDSGVDISRRDVCGILIYRCILHFFQQCSALLGRQLEDQRGHGALITDGLCSRLQRNTSSHINSPSMRLLAIDIILCGF